MGHVSSLASQILAPSLATSIRSGIGTYSKPDHSEPLPVPGHCDWFTDGHMTQFGRVKVEPVTLEELWVERRRPEGVGMGVLATS